MKQNLVIIGNGMVGYKFIEKLTELGATENYNIITFCEEPRPAYDRVHLSEYFTGQDAEALSLASAEWYAERGVTLHLNDAVATVDRSAKSITSKKGETIQYDKLVFATGSLPFVPPIPGIDKAGVFVYRTIEDLDETIAYSKQCKTAAVIGGGLLGLEAAKALIDLNLETHVVEFAPRLMPRQIDQMGSDVLRKKIADLGVTVHLSKATQAIAGEDAVSGMEFADESKLDVDMVVVSAGIRPRDELAKECGLKIGERGGIEVNNFMQTSDPDVYAIGECALYNSMIYGLVAPGYRMAETACHHLLSKPGEFTGADMSTKLKLMGIDVASVGDSTVEGEGIESCVVVDERSGVYKRLAICPETNTLKGAILVGDAEEYGQLLQYYLNAMPLPESPSSLIMKGSSEEGGMGVDGLPETAQICSCENVNKGEIITAISDGCKDLPSIKSCTKAGTGCGSCVPLVTDILNSELEKSGLTVDKSICEHFPYTRQELAQIVRASKITKFDELLGRYGKGRGCEVCKPAVASILASYVNEYVLENENLQDTNDAFLANIQRNGTYSVVPRVPGGEITPKQLIAIGEVADEYKLYTKITGGQRIDLFGARVEDLPPIWEKLGAAGLESGHAYAKALRTVKSCVGSAWCRFGVQDSTGMAIKLENRYKGLRAPHKIKLAVSGCARECAEAQSKDVGVIATEKGWNLYVCGNGGMKPQHAQLFAEDLDSETLIRYVDRLFMYYVRTADKLTRTATWLNKLPGGLQHLTEVVIEDSLGICEELEAEMQHLVDTYECEWKKTIENPEKRKRFQPFVNSKETDETIRFEQNRGQIQPLTTQ